ncbi:hypothetical protein F5Y17DRAFT_40859 [Xylariaceae sp. FL0594]|nr:hypothetical protein F5Y17DRAFT_40859 [Xylariaceae sp. FL0594]
MYRAGVAGGKAAGDSTFTGVHRSNTSPKGRRKGWTEEEERRHAPGRKPSRSISLTNKAQRRDDNKYRQTVGSTEACCSHYYYYEEEEEDRRADGVPVTQCRRRMMMTRRRRRREEAAVAVAVAEFRALRAVASRLTQRIADQEKRYKELRDGLFSRAGLSSNRWWWTTPTTPTISDRNWSRWEEEVEEFALLDESIAEMQVELYGILSFMCFCFMTMSADDDKDDYGNDDDIYNEDGTTRTIERRDAIQKLSFPTCSYLAIYVLPHVTIIGRLQQKYALGK